MPDAQVDFTEAELLEDIPVTEPLIAGGIRCHGGFDEAGNYVSPRTLNRWRAIENWEAGRAETFGTPPVDLAMEDWPENYPNVDQARFLIAQGAPEPVIATLTRIGTVEGFGAMIRYSAIPAFQSLFDEDVSGTAISHLDKGLFEAHARDEAGFGAQGGHKQMWFAARDIAFEYPVTEDETQTMLERMGITQAVSGAKGVPDPAAISRQIHGIQSHPEINFELEVLLERMTRLLMIEISAYHIFAWAQEVLSDTSLVAGEGEAGDLVAYIRQDEGPHVAYLKTVLSEVRDRTIVGESGMSIPGAGVVGEIWERARRESIGERREEFLNTMLGEVEFALRGRTNAPDLLREFHALGSVRPDEAGRWVAKEPAE